MAADGLCMVDLCEVCECPRPSGGPGPGGKAQAEVEINVQIMMMMPQLNAACHGQGSRIVSSESHAQPEEGRKAACAPGPRLVACKSDVSPCWQSHHFSSARLLCMQPLSTAVMVRARETSPPATLLVESAQT